MTNTHNEWIAMTIYRMVVGRIALTSAMVVCAASSAAAQTPAGAPAAPAIRVTSTAYFQYTASLSDTIGNANSFDVTRAYINVLGKFEKGIATRVTADIYRPADATLTFRLKYAYIAWTPEGSNLTAKLGAIQTPWLDFEEALWDYRMQGPAIFDRAGYMTSSDLGASVDGSWNSERFNVHAAIVNGEGYSKPGTDRGKDFQMRASLRVAGTDDPSRVGGLRVTGYAGLGRYAAGGPRNRFAGMLSFRSSRMTIAAQALATKDRLASGGDADGMVIGGFGVLHARNTPWSLIARAAHIDPNTDADDDASTIFIAGPSYQLSPNVRLLLDIDHTGYQADVQTAAQQVSRTRALFQAMFSF
jgi:hypothetical protein